MISLPIVTNCYCYGPMFTPTNLETQMVSNDKDNNKWTEHVVQYG